MQRRKFIKNSLLASLFLSVPPLRGEATGAYAAAPKNTFKKSMMWGTVGMEGTVLEKCKAMKAAGFDGVEPNSHMDRQEMLAAMKATGLKASSVCNSKHWEITMSDPDPAVRKKAIDNMIYAMEDAKAYGTDAVLLVPGTVNESITYDQCWERSTQCIKQLVPIAEKMQVKIGIENVWNNFLLSPMEAARYIDQFNSKMIGFYFDAGNILPYGWPEQWIKILDHRIVRIHIKEFSRKIADKEGRYAGFSAKLTEGDNNWTKIMAAIKEVNYGPWLTIEHHGGETPEGLIDLSQRLNKIIES